MTRKRKLYDVASVAKSTSFPGGRNKFIMWLVEKGYFLSNHEPAQRYIDNGWMVLTRKKIILDGEPEWMFAAKFTHAGIAGLEKILDREFPLCQPCEGDT